jgi:hypothetical protein
MNKVIEKERGLRVYMVMEYVISSRPSDNCSLIYTYLIISLISLIYIINRYMEHDLKRFMEKV